MHRPGQTIPAPRGCIGEFQISGGRLQCPEEAGEVVAGVSHLPAMDELFTASRGGGAFLNGQPIRASNISDPSQAVLCVNQFTTIRQYGFSEGLLEWMSQFWAVRSMGGCLDAMMVSRGQADLWIETAGKPWDFAPLKIIAEEAGARFFNFDGGSSIYGGNCVVCAPGMEQRSLLASKHRGTQKRNAHEIRKRGIGIAVAGSEDTTRVD